MYFPSPLFQHQKCKTFPCVRHINIDPILEDRLSATTSAVKAIKSDSTIEEHRRKHMQAIANNFQHSHSLHAWLLNG